MISLYRISPCNSVLKHPKSILPLCPYHNNRSIRFQLSSRKITICKINIHMEMISPGIEEEDAATKIWL